MAVLPPLPAHSPSFHPFPPFTPTTPTPHPPTPPTPQEFAAFLRVQTVSELVVDRTASNELLKITFNMRWGGGGAVKRGGSWSAEGFAKGGVVSRMQQATQRVEEEAFNRRAGGRRALFSCGHACLKQPF
jgi:hypothetical protein